jgi:hypothetical protein
MMYGPMEKFHMEKTIDKTHFLIKNMLKPSFLEFPIVTSLLHHKTTGWWFGTLIIFP